MEVKEGGERNRVMEIKEECVFLDGHTRHTDASQCAVHKQTEVTKTHHFQRLCVCWGP